MSGRDPMSQSKATRTELAVSFVLRFGVILSAAVIVLGLVLLAVRGGQGSQGDLAAARSFPHSVATVWSGLLAFDPVSVITLGLILVILTPISRVAVSIVAFAAEGDRRYVIVTAIVLAILVASLVLGKAGS